MSDLETPAPDLVYCGAGAYLAGVPGRDLSAAEVAVSGYSRAALLDSGLYKAAAPAPAPSTKDKDPEPVAPEAPAPEPTKAPKRGTAPDPEAP